MPNIARLYDFQARTKILSQQVDDELNQLVGAHNDHETQLQDRYTKEETDSKFSSTGGGQSYSIRSGSAFPAAPSEYNVFALTQDQVIGGLTYPGHNSYIYLNGKWNLTITSLVNQVPANLVRGLQKVHSDLQSPLSNVMVKGRTLVNLLGNDGNCEDTSKWVTWFTSTLTVDNANYAYGSGSIKAVATGTGGFGIYQDVTNKIQANKYYIVLCEIKNGVGNGAFIRFNINSNVMADGSAVTDTSKFALSYGAFQAPSSVSSAFLYAYNYGTVAVNDYAYFDGIRLYEISQSEYNAIDSMTADQIAAKYPYVDNLKSLNGVYVKRYGKNLLPPFTEWTLSSSTVVNEPYNATTTTSSYVESYVEVKLIPNETYVGNSGLFFVRHYDANGNTIRDDSGAGSFVVPSNASYQHVIFGVASNTTLSNPMLKLGTTVLPFEPQNDDYVYVNGGELASSVDGSVYDELYQADAVTWRKNKRFEQKTLDGSLDWTLQSSSTGWKIVQLNSLAPTPASTDDLDDVTLKVVKYDGKILAPYNPTTTSDEAWITAGLFRITVAGTDSGWGDSYTPTAAEIGAYFDGWKMNNGTFGTNYDGTGTKTWIPWNATDNTGAVTVVPTTPSTAITSGTYDYYFLQYQLAQAQDVPATVEGSLSFFAGDNQVELGEGVIVREPVIPVLWSAAGNYYINEVSASTSTFTKYPTEKIIKVYKDGKEDNLWIIRAKPDCGNGAYDAYIPASQYDPTAAYSVTYIAEPNQVSSAVESATGSVESNYQDVIQKNTQDIADLGEDLSSQDIRLTRRFVEGNSLKIQTGTATASQVVTFEEAFSGKPVMYPSNVTAVTATGFTMNTSGGDWIAIGPK